MRGRTLGPGPIFPTLEDVAEMSSDPGLDLGPFDRPAQERRQRRYTPVGDAARNDEAEVIELSCDIERESVAGDPARNPDADRCEFLIPDPDACQPVHALRGQAVVRRSPNEDLFQVPDIAMDIASIRTKVDDRIADDLPRP